ncbi:MAG: DUF202 domain-containing protein [Solobacterium sp.]|nr:DUF202 domain-containing protein [Solobacterium sp.]
MDNKTEIKLSNSDKLALTRTDLANERTMLAYVRTFIGMVSAGIAILKVFDFPWTRPIAVLFLGCSVPMLVIGIYRYVKTGNNLKEYFNPR